MESIALRLTGSNAVVGEVVGEVAILPVTSRNYLGIARGYSVDAGVLRAIESVGAGTIEFRHKKTQRRWRVGVDAFKACARSFDFGFGQKLAAPDSIYEEIMDEGQS